LLATKPFAELVEKPRSIIAPIKLVDLLLVLAIVYNFDGLPFSSILEIHPFRVVPASNEEGIK
jgi:hypothetical protein